MQQVIDHLGKTYRSEAAMCSAYHINKCTYRKRIQKGWSVEEALTLSTKILVNRGERTDHLGNTFQSEKEMCEHYGVSQNTYRNRIRQGWSQEKALTKELYKSKISPVDHKGTRYESVARMCNAYGVTETLFRQRVRHGKTLEEALTEKKRQWHRHTTDHLGKQYQSLKEMCAASISPHHVSGLRIAFSTNSGEKSPSSKCNVGGGS